MNQPPPQRINWGVVWAAVAALATVAGVIVAIVLKETSGDDSGDGQGSTTTTTRTSTSNPEGAHPPPPTPSAETVATTYQVSMENWIRLGPYLHQVGGRPFTAAVVVAGSNGEVTVEDSTCTSMTLRAGLQDATGGRTGSSTITVQGESDTWGSMTVESGVPAIEGGPFAIEPGLVQLSVRGSADLTVVSNGELTCLTPDGRR
jgi:hypothetical protein